MNSHIKLNKQIQEFQLPYQYHRIFPQKEEHILKLCNPHEWDANNFDK